MGCDTRDFNTWLTLWSINWHPLTYLQRRTFPQPTTPPQFVVMEHFMNVGGFFVDLFFHKENFKNLERICFTKFATICRFLFSKLWSCFTVFLSHIRMPSRNIECNVIACGAAIRAWEKGISQNLTNGSLENVLSMYLDLFPDVCFVSTMKNYHQITTGCLEKFHIDLLPLKLTACPWKWMVGRWISFWDGPFLEANVSFRECSFRCRKKVFQICIDTSISFQFKFVSIHNMFPTKRKWYEHVLYKSCFNCDSSVYFPKGLICSRQKLNWWNIFGTLFEGDQSKGGLCCFYS